ncbi:MAG: peptide chain release factor-like protein [Planctomycetaceae bacterium]|nr:peptide chain release factor-like protein [Planctomycetaceae bacterium]
MLHPAALSIDQLLAQCEVRRTRASGPGGQHRNKVETAVVVTHRPTGIAAEGTERRSQAQNHAAAVLRLRLKLALAVRTEWREPSSLWQSRARGGRISVSAQHDDFPALVAESLDALAHGAWDAAATAQALGVSTSQLVKLLKLEPAALALLNGHRQSAGQHPLR